MQPAPRGAAVHSGPVHGSAHRLLWEVTGRKAQARKLASQQAMLKLGPGRKLTSMRRLKPASAQVTYRGPWTKYREPLTVGLD